LEKFERLGINAERIRENEEMMGDQVVIEEQDFPEVNH